MLEREDTGLGRLNGLSARSNNSGTLSRTRKAQTKTEKKWLLRRFAHYSGLKFDRLLVDERIMPSHPTQILANEYTPRIGIAPHSDYSSSGKIIAGLSLGSPVIMDFIGPEQQKLSQLLEHRNLYSIFGPARYKRKHGIASRKGAKYLGEYIERKRRLSFTFRIATHDNGGAA
jgi:alkylated DNA repair dioxygenase AlkB